MFVPMATAGWSTEQTKTKIRSVGWIGRFTCNYVACKVIMVFSKIKNNWLYLTESVLVSDKRWLMSVYNLIVSWESFPHWWPVCCGMELGPHRDTWLPISISWNSAHIASNQWLGCKVGPSLSQSRLLFAHRQLWLPSPFFPLPWIPIGVKDPCSTSFTRWTYPLFSFLWLRKHWGKGRRRLLGARGLKNHTSKNVHWRQSPQNPCGQMSWVPSILQTYSVPECSLVQCTAMFCYGEHWQPAWCMFLSH